MTLNVNEQRYDQLFLTTDHINTALWKLCCSYFLMGVHVQPVTLLTFNADKCLQNEEQNAWMLT